MGVSSQSALSKRFLFFLSIVFLLLFSFFPFFMIETSRAGHTWGIEFVDRTGNYVGYYSSIKIDSQGRPHISYMGEELEEASLKYAHWNGVTWTIKVVDSSVTVSWGTSLALDGFDRPHISYCDYDNEDLRYAHWNVSGWEIEVIDSLGEVGFLSSLDLDSQGRPHITYGVIQNGTRHIRYAHWNGTSWNFHDLDYSNRAGHSHLVLDSMDTPHMSFYDITEGNVMYAKWDGLDWLVELVDDEGGSGNQNSLALDSSDRPRIAYHVTYLPGDDEVRYAYWNGTSWVIETSFAGGATSYSSVSLDLDSHGNPGIAYSKPSVGDLLYFWKSEGLWYNETVDPIVAYYCHVPSLTFDQMDFPHISYCYDGESLLHATVIPPPLPDLTLSETDISFNPPSPVLNGTSVNITATIRNMGGIHAWDVYVRFYDGRPPSGVQIDGDQNLGTIPSLSSATASLQWTAGPPGTHEICVHADPDNTVMEFNETNNMACRFIEVISSSIPGPPLLLDATLSGWNLENVTLRWDISADDGEGSKSVLRYDVYRDTKYNPNGGYPLYDSIPNGTSHYADVGAGKGDSSNYFYYICAVNAVNNSSCSPNQAGKFARTLLKGPNLVSIPLIQSNESIERVLQTVRFDKAWTYRPYDNDSWKWYMRFKPYKGDLPSVDHTMGLWMNVTENSNLTVAGIVPAQTTMSLHEGWNLVGFPSFNSTFTVSHLNATIGAMKVEGFEAVTSPFFLRALSDSDILKTGHGYWVRVASESTWIIEFA